MLSDLCAWKGHCRCTPDYVGDTCNQSVVEFRSHGGACALANSNPDFCKGLGLHEGPLKYSPQIVGFPYKKDPNKAPTP